MTIETTTTTTTLRDEKPSGPRKRWYRNLFNACGKYLGGTFRRGAVIAALSFIFLGFLLVFHQVDTINRNARDADSFAAANVLYLYQVQQFSSQQAQYELCLDGVTRSDQNRNSWASLAEDIAALPGDVAAMVADHVRHNDVLSSPPRLASDCVAPPPLPKPPTHP